MSGESSEENMSGENLSGESAGGESAGGESAGGESAGGESAGGESAGGEKASGENISGKPGTPYATQIGINEITLQWSRPQQDIESIRSYEVLYHPENGEGMNSDPVSCGLQTEKCIKNLSEDVMYIFQVQAIDQSGGKKVSESVSITTKEYYDIVIVGMTGLGKSTLGNKLLNVAATDASKIRLFSRDNSDSSKKRFTTADDCNPDEQKSSVTEACKLMANDYSKNRVLDVPGFSDTNSLQRGTGQGEGGVSVYEGNLQIVRWVVGEQKRSKPNVRRIVYFLPVRGPLEKADGTMQEELKVLHYFFGKGVFECMVVVATNPKRQQKYKYDDKILQTDKEVFTAALKHAIPEKDITCPPIVYIGLHDSHDECLSKIKEAQVVKDTIFSLKFSEDTCAHCAIKFVSNEEKKISIIHTDGTTATYEDSKCHSSFVSKYTGAQKFFGGVGHMASLGIGLVVDKFSDNDSWPGFTNSDEICASCKNSPGSNGCLPVGTTITMKNKTIYVDHTSELERTQLEHTPSVINRCLTSFSSSFSLQ